jgi:hypothetical protein
MELQVDVRSAKKLETGCRKGAQDCRSEVDSLCNRKKDVMDRRVSFRKL